MENSNIKKILGIMAIMIFLFYNHSFAIEKEERWYERYEYNSENIQKLINEKEIIQKEINVEPQQGKYDLVIFMGQSNMVGRGGDASKAVEPIEGAGYELEFNRDGSIDGLKPMKEPFGKNTENTIGGSMVTAFTNAYYNNSGTPVIGIAAAYNGTSIYNFWQNGQEGLENAKAKLNKAVEWLEIQGYSIRHKYMIWNQGEADVSKIEFVNEKNEKQTYERALQNTIREMQNVGIEKCFMIRIGTIYLYQGYEDKYKERYQEYLNMVKEQTRIANNDWITLISTNMLTLSKCEKMMTDMVHFNQEALDIIGSEAGKNVARYADEARRKTLTQNQESRLIKFAKEFAEEGFKNQKLVYGILSKQKAYNLQLVHYPSPYVELVDGKRLKVINFGPYGEEYGWNGEKTEEEFKANNYIGLDCSGFIAFLYHRVFGLPFNYNYNQKEMPWTTEQFIENREIEKFDGSGKIKTFKVIYEQHSKEQKYTLNDLAKLAELQPGDLLIGRGGIQENDNTNHIVMYSGKNQNGTDKIIHSTGNPELYNMYIEDEYDKRKYYYAGETDLANSTFKYRNVYVLRLNEGILPYDYIDNDKKINWNKLSTQNNYDDVSPKIKIEYSTTEPTNQNVIVNIISNEEIQEVEGWNLLENKKGLKKEYSRNTKENIKIKDIAGNTTTATVEINNIDKIAPELEIIYSTTEPTNQNVIVNIISNEEIQEVEGWSLLDNKKELTKEYNKNTEEILLIKDKAQNQSSAKIKINNIESIVSPIQTGDINKNGKIDVTDIIKLKRYLIREDKNNWQLTEEELKLADMNKDGKVDITDLIMLKNKLIKSTFHISNVDTTETFDLNLESQSKKIEKEKEFQVDIVLENIKVTEGDNGIAGYSTKIIYNKNILELISVKSEEWEVIENEGKILANSKNAEVVKEKNITAQVVFKIKDNVENEITDIKLENIEGTSGTTNINGKNKKLEIEIVNKEQVDNIESEDNSIEDTNNSTNSVKPNNVIVGNDFTFTSEQLKLPYVGKKDILRHMILVILVIAIYFYIKHIRAYDEKK